MPCHLRHLENVPFALNELCKCDVFVVIAFSLYLLCVPCLSVCFCLSVLQCHAVLFVFCLLQCHAVFCFSVLLMFVFNRFVLHPMLGNV